ncbi:hypothetical protein MMC24_000163 [Lignoscripta atroalba]|nr:hypothetical protein [Lignoscripta atroalba]
MARTLPWLASKSSTAAEPRPRPVKRHRVMDLESEDDAVSTTGVSTPRRIAIARAERTPSTSPPPAPPTEELMHEGLDRDDIYIMVEDEFQAVAKTFTQHLHHAEYMRLKNLAKVQNASAITTISRPVDSITAMREETKRRKAADARASKQKSALQHIHAQAAARRPRTDSDKEESDLEVTRDDDPWVGTTLQGLMTSPRKDLTSLTGLQGVKSNTRAAAGYSKPERRPPPTARPFDLTSKSSAAKQTTPQQSADEATATTGDDDDDDLDAPAPRKIPASSKPNETPTKRAAQEIARMAMAKDPRSKAKNAHFDDLPLPSLPSPPTSRSSTAKKTPSSSKPPTKSILKSTSPLSDLDMFSDLPRPSALQGGGGEAASRRRIKRMADLKAKEDRETKRRHNSVNEIPIFLV